MSVPASLAMKPAHNTISHLLDEGHSGNSIFNFHDEPVITQKER